MNGVRLRAEKAFCFCNPKYCQFTTCNIKVKSRHVANMNMIATVKQNLTNVQYTMKTFYQFSNNEYRPMLIDNTFNYCDDGKGVVSSSLLKYLQTVWGNSTNIFKPCPISPGEYYVKDWSFAASDLPSGVIPGGRYLVKTLLHTDDGKVSFLNTSLYFYVSNYGTTAWNLG